MCRQLSGGKLGPVSWTGLLFFWIVEYGNFEKIAVGDSSGGNFVPDQSAIAFTKASRTSE